MKFEQTEIVPAFQPINLTIESQQELDYIVALIEGTTPSIEKAFGIKDEKVYPVWSKLEDLASPGRPRLVVSLATTRGVKQ
jgi:hypothetical protein